MSQMQTYKKDISDEERRLYEERRQADLERPRQFVNFAFYRLDPQFRREFNDQQRAEMIDDYAKVVDVARQKFLIYPYSTLGLRPETDFLLWRISYRVEDFQTIYVDENADPAENEHRNKIVIGGGKYLFVYPFVKTRAWYVLPQEKRMESMREHIRVGHQFPSVKLNTTYSFGLDDQDFVVAFESDYPQDFMDLVKQLRETDSSTHTLRDTPTFTCIQQDLRTTLAHVCGVDPSRL
jgi:chlorite dismutase